VIGPDWLENSSRSYVYLKELIERIASMYISRKNSCTKKWPDAYQPKINKDVRADEADSEVAADPDLDNWVMPSPERPHDGGLS
jgi:hypothetical protein